MISEFKIIVPGLNHTGLAVPTRFTLSDGETSRVDMELGLGWDAA